jgi:hypothetical protein
MFYVTNSLREAGNTKICNGLFKSGATSITPTGSVAEAGLKIGVLEDNDDGDDTASSGCDWVLSIRDKPTVTDF